MYCNIEIIDTQPPQMCIYWYYVIMFHSTGSQLDGARETRGEERAEQPEQLQGSSE